MITHISAVRLHSCVGSLQFLGLGVRNPDRFPSEQRLVQTPLQVQSSIERNESILLCLHIPQTHTCTPACVHTAPVLSSSISGSSFLSRPSYPLTHLHGNSQTCIISPSAVLPCSLSCQFLFSWTLHCLSHRTPFLHPLTLRYIEPSFYIF